MIELRHNNAYAKKDPCDKTSKNSREFYELITPKLVFDLLMTKHLKMSPKSHNCGLFSIHL